MAYEPQLPSKHLCSVIHVVPILLRPFFQRRPIICWFPLSFLSIPHAAHTYPGAKPIFAFFFCFHLSLRVYPLSILSCTLILRLTLFIASIHDPPDVNAATEHYIFVLYTAFLACATTTARCSTFLPRLSLGVNPVRVAFPNRSCMYGVNGFIARATAMTMQSYTTLVPHHPKVA